MRTLRWTLSFIYLWFNRKCFKPLFGFDNKSKSLEKTGVKSLPEAWFRERPRPLESNDRAIDSISFQGVNNNSDVILVSLNRLHGRTADVWIYLKFANGEEYQLPHQPATHVYNTDGKHFSAAGLTFEVLEPLRRWRIAFSGILRNCIHSGLKATESNDLVNVKFNFIWHPMYNYIAFPHDIKPTILAGLLSGRGSSALFQHPSDMLKEEWHEQFGEMSGTVKIDDRDEFEVMARGLKKRRHGVLNWNGTQKTISIMGVVENGNAFHLFADNSVTGLRNFVYGYILPAHNMEIHHVNKWQNDIEAFQSQDKFRLQLKAGGKNYNLNMAGKQFQFTIFEQENWELELNVRIYEVNLNGKKGFAVAQFGRPYTEGSPLPKQSSAELLEEPRIENCTRSIVAFKDVECQSSSIVGGKASSLSLMTTLLESSNGLECSFRIPNGVCLTKQAFQFYEQSHPLISSAISTIENVSWKCMDGSLQDECNRIASLMETTSLSTSLKDELRKVLSNVFGKDFESKRFAVRSSAIGEDGEEMSAAGQNETFLGVKEFDNICSSVIKCWVSQFSFRSVEYKRQNGQVINGGMGVVIQEMISADIAGVLFTRHPLTHSPAYIVLTSNYGLGESVVAGTVDPDTVTLRRSWNDQLEMFEKQIGTKTQRIAMSDDQGTAIEENDAEFASKCSISDQLALRLGKIAIDLEHRFGGARDIEWAVMDDEIFLLQSRPVTVENAMTDYELIHEFDIATRTDHECFTTGNLGEVMPGTITPLSMTTEFRAHNATFFADVTWKVNSHRYDPTVVDGIACFYGHFFFDLVQLRSFGNETTKSQMLKAVEIGFYGRVLDSEHIDQMANERFGGCTPLSVRMKLMKFALHGMFFSKSILKSGNKKYRNFQVPVFECQTAAAVYEIIENEYYSDWSPSSNVHLRLTSASTGWNFIVLNMLTDSDGEFTLEKYTDFATLIGSNNGSESGDVPFSIQELARAIGEEIEPNKFCSMDLSIATDWCNHNETVAGQKFKEFLQRHGHRGLNEFDLSAVTWGMKPEKLVQVLQSILKHPHIADKPKETNMESVFDSISTQFSATKRRLVSYFLAKAKQGICDREKSKSMLIKTVDGYRHAYRHLAKMMVREGLLPDSELVFFLTHEEIGVLLNDRSSTLIRRAKQRQRIHKYTDPLVFEEMIVGFPKPVPQIKEEIVTDGEVRITGYPVCQGKVRGTARVVSFHDISTIQLGDILIAHATDIGWSPYFPMLGGVVTEIGGLISHGAVVAREFGLPCIVGAQNATHVFSSGDIVFLNAHDGFVSKVV